MPMEGDLLMIAEGGVGIVNRMVTVCRLLTVDRLMFSIVIRVCFYIRIPFDLGPSHVWL